MATLHVGTLDVVYRDGRTAARFKPVLRAMLEEGLGRALDEVGLDPGEQVCIRELEVPVRLDAGASDAALVEAWGRAIAAKVRAAREAPEPGADGVVRWRSTRHARLDLLLSFAAGEAGRAWAWRRAGLLPRGQGAPHPEEVLRALAAEPRDIVALLVAAAEAGRLVRLARLFPRRAWLALAMAALEAHGIPAHLVPAAIAGPAPDLEPSPFRVAAEALAGRSRLGRAARTGRLAVADAEAAAALAALSVLEAEPGRLAAPDGAEVIAAVARVLAGTADGELESASDARGRQAKTNQAEGSEGASDEAAARESRAAPESAPRPATSRGGLVYLLHLVSAEGLPAVLCEEPRGLRWWLHGLGCVLANARERDPAVLTFAGLAPDAQPPSTRLPAATEEERDRLCALAASVEARLARVVEADPIGLAELIARPAEVLADPGWIEVRFPLSAVDTRVRRAGLDLDPDFVPWLGCVVRFSYV